MPGTFGFLERLASPRTPRNTKKYYGSGQALLWDTIPMVSHSRSRRGDVD